MILGFQDARRPLQQRMIIFRDYLIRIVLPIGFVVLMSLVRIFNSFFIYRLLTDDQCLEFLWTLFPRLVILIILIPSLRLLYLTDSSAGRRLRRKAIGHQWYWQYDIPDTPNYNSYLTEGLYRLLTTDHRMIMKKDLTTQVFVTAADVLHSWTLPTIGIKGDAVPGRVNILRINPSRAGVFFGQCSEICGSNHSFIPIVAECTLFNLLTCFESGHQQRLRLLLFVYFSSAPLY